MILSKDLLCKNKDDTLDQLGHKPIITLSSRKVDGRKDAFLERVRNRDTCNSDFYIHGQF